MRSPPRANVEAATIGVLSGAPGRPSGRPATIAHVSGLSSLGRGRSATVGGQYRSSCGRSEQARGPLATSRYRLESVSEGKTCGMTHFPDSHSDLLDASFATLATVRSDGFPHMTEVWFLHENGELKLSL